MRGWVAGVLGGCAGEASTPRDPVPDEGPAGHPGIQIGQTGTAYTCDVVTLADPAAPTEGFPFAAADWWAGLDLGHDAVFGPMDGASGDVDGAALAVTVTGTGGFGIAGGACTPHYVADAVVSLQAGDLLSVEFDAQITAQDAATATWRVEVPADRVGGTLGEPELGTLAGAPRVLESSGRIGVEGAEGQLGWRVDDGDPYYVWWVPVATWSSVGTR